MTQVTLAELLRNPLKEKLARGEVASSMIVRISRGVEIGRIAATAGLDTLYVDLEHSVLSLETCALICTAAREAGVTPLVRVPQLEASLIARILDSGAMGLILPHVESAEDARRAVSYAQYPPQGTRSVSSGLALLHYRSFPAAEANAAMNDSLFLAAMVESKRGLENIEAIAAVRGIDMLFVGAGDLSTDLGLPGQVDHPEMQAAFRRVLAAAQAHGKIVGAGGMAGQSEALGRLVKQGVQFVSTGTDLGFLSEAIAQRVRLVRQFNEG